MAIYNMFEAKGTIEQNIWLSQHHVVILAVHSDELDWIDHWGKKKEDESEALNMVILLTSVCKIYPSWHYLIVSHRLRNHIYNYVLPGFLSIVNFTLFFFFLENDNLQKFNNIFSLVQKLYMRSLKYDLSFIVTLNHILSNNESLLNYAPLLCLSYQELFVLDHIIC